MQAEILGRKPAGIFAVVVWAGPGATVACALSAFVVVAVTLNYHPTTSWRALVVDLAPVAAMIVASFVLLKYRLQKRPLAKVRGVLSALLGLGFAGPGSWVMVNDPGDAILYAGPVVVGICLVTLAFEPKNEGSA